MKTILFILFFPLLLLGQYTNNLISNSTFADATGWSLSGTATISGGTLNITGDGTTSNYATVIIAAYTTPDSFKFKYDVTANTLNTSTQAIYWAGKPFVFDATGDWLPSHLTAASHVTRTYVISSGTEVRIRTKTGAASGTLSFDNMYCYKKLDTLYIDSGQADETDDDSTKTLTEAFVTRGAHSGGTFITTAGTYSETIAIDSSFTMWKSATAGQAVTVTAVDFAGVTATLLDIYVTTPTNDSNITYTYTPATATTRKRNFDGWGKYGGWLK